MCNPTSHIQVLTYTNIESLFILFVAFGLLVYLNCSGLFHDFPPEKYICCKFYVYGSPLSSKLMESSRV
jgi:hypothetical protein